MMLGQCPKSQDSVRVSQRLPGPLRRRGHHVRRSLTPPTFHSLLALIGRWSTSDCCAFLAHARSRPPPVAGASLFPDAGLQFPSVSDSRALLMQAALRSSCELLVWLKHAWFVLTWARAYLSLAGVRFLAFTPSHSAARVPPMIEIGPPVRRRRIRCCALPRDERQRSQGST
jgi:hypothetical protein